MEDGYEGSGSFDGTSRWMNVNIDGNFELNATFNSNVSLDAVSIPYFYSGFKPGDGQSSFSVTYPLSLLHLTLEKIYQHKHLLLLQNPHLLKKLRKLLM